MLAHYRILEQIGAGGMGVVYRAHDEHLDRDVALKVLPAGALADEAARRRFRKEALALSKLNHPNIATVHDFDTQETTDFLVEELIVGLSLSEVLLSGPLPEREILNLGSQLCEGLAAAHEQGVIHRDLKPANIRVTPDARLKILDFGLAKVLHTGATDSDTDATASMTESQTVSGTLPYMAPEQLLNENLDPRTDLWAAGCVLYEMATGKRPFSGSGPALTDAILHQPPAAPSGLNRKVTPGLEAIILKCLEQDRDLRYQHASEMRADLKRLERQVTGQQSSSAIPISGSSQPAPSLRSSSQILLGEAKRHKRWVVGMVAALLLSMVGVAAGAYWWATTRRRGFRLDQLTVVEVTNENDTRQAVISPDGRYLAYTREDADKVSLWVQQIGTGAAVQVVASDPLTYLGEPNFSPGSESIYFVKTDKNPNVWGQSHLYRIPVLGGTPRQILANVETAPTFSPDGKRLAVLREVERNKEIAFVTANLDGTDERVAARSPVFRRELRNVAWSPDGRWLAANLFVERRGVPQMVLELISVADGSARDLLADSNNSAIAWLPDGSGLLMIRSAGEVRGQIAFVPYPKGDVSWFTHEAASYDSSSLSITQDGKSVAAVQDRGDSAPWVMRGKDAAAARPVPLQNVNGFFLDWLPDGRVVAATQKTGEIVAIKPDGTQRTQIVPKDAWPFTVCRPTGYVVFARAAEDGTANLWRVELDGSNLTQLTKGQQHAAIPRCSPDGKWLVYASDFKIWRVGIEGGTPTELASTGSLRVPWADISPEGNRIMYRFLDGSQPRIAIIAASDGRQLQVIDNRRVFEGVPRWSADGTGLSYRDVVNGVGNLWEQPLAGGPPRQLTNFTWGSWPGQSAYSPDGQLAVIRAQGRNNAVLITNFR